MSEDVAGLSGLAVSEVSDPEYLDASEESSPGTFDESFPVSFGVVPFEISEAAVTVISGPDPSEADTFYDVDLSFGLSSSESSSSSTGILRAAASPTSISCIFSILC